MREEKLKMRLKMKMRGKSFIHDVLVGCVGFFSLYPKSNKKPVKHFNLDNNIINFAFFETLCGEWVQRILECLWTPKMGNQCPCPARDGHEFG